MEDTEIANPLKYALSILDKPLFKELVSDSYNRIVAKNTIRIKPTILKEAEIEQVILELAIKEADKFIKQQTRLQFKYNGDTLILESKYDSFYDSLIIANLSQLKERYQTPYNIIIPNIHYPHQNRNCPNLFSPKICMIFAYCNTLTIEEREIAKHYLCEAKKNPRIIWNKEDKYIETCKYLLYHPAFKKLHKISWKQVSEDFLKFFLNLKVS